MLRVSLVLSLVMALVLGLGTLAVRASEPEATVFPADLTVEQAQQLLLGSHFEIVGCGECQIFDMEDIPLCPPARSLGPIIKIVEFEQDPLICVDKVLVNIRVTKIIFYIDINGTARIRRFVTEVGCCIDIPGVLPGDNIAFRRVVVQCEKDELRNDGRILHEKLCIKVNVSVQRRFPCI
jgi:hypothetical protein